MKHWIKEENSVRHTQKKRNQSWHPFYYSRVQEIENRANSNGCKNIIQYSQLDSKQLNGCSTVSCVTSNYIQHWSQSLFDIDHMQYVSVCLYLYAISYLQNYSCIAQTSLLFNALRGPSDITDVNQIIPYLSKSCPFISEHLSEHYPKGQTLARMNQTQWYLSVFELVVKMTWDRWRRNFTKCS